VPADEGQQQPSRGESSVDSLHAKHGDENAQGPKEQCRPAARSAALCMLLQPHHLIRLSHECAQAAQRDPDMCCGVCCAASHALY
jgi:hypothetical protein